jgi:hypothetical protein
MVGIVIFTARRVGMATTTLLVAATTTTAAAAVILRHRGGGATKVRTVIDVGSIAR